MQPIILLLPHDDRTKEISQLNDRKDSKVWLFYIKVKRAPKRAWNLFFDDFRELLRLRVFNQDKNIQL